MHGDNRGSIKEISYGRSHYFRMMTTGEQRYVRVKQFQNREKIEHYFNDYICWNKRHTIMTVGLVHTDNASEILSMRREKKVLDITLTALSAHKLQPI